MRILALSLGNSTLLGATILNGRLVRIFRLPKASLVSSAKLEKDFSSLAKSDFDGAVVASVVPALTKALCTQLKRQIGEQPLILTAASQERLHIAYRDPSKLGADRLAAALGAQARFPEKPIVIVDCGTATTVTLVTPEGSLCGGAIIPGLGLWAEALASRTAQLPLVKAARPRFPVGRSPQEAIRSGLYIGHLGAIEKLVRCLSANAFGNRKPIVIATGGASVVFAREKLFTLRAPNLILEGLRAFAADKFEHA